MFASFISTATKLSAPSIVGSDRKTAVAMIVSKKPTRRDLLKVVTELQALISKGRSLHGNDRNPHGFEQGQNVLQEAFELCIAARSFDPPTDI